MVRARPLHPRGGPCDKFTATLSQDVVRLQANHRGKTLSQLTQQANCTPIRQFVREADIPSALKLPVTLTITQNGMTWLQVSLDLGGDVYLVEKESIVNASAVDAKVFNNRHSYVYKVKAVSGESLANFVMLPTKNPVDDNLQFRYYRSRWTRLCCIQKLHLVCRAC